LKPLKESKTRRAEVAPGIKEQDVRFLWGKDLEKGKERSS